MRTKKLLVYAYHICTVMKTLELHYLILFSVKREFRKLFFATRDLKVSRYP